MRSKYLKYIIDPMFSVTVKSEQQILPLKLYKTLGLYSLRMANVVCQSPLNQIISQTTQSQGLIKSPHCTQLGFLTSMVREEWSTISPPPKQAIPPPAPLPTPNTQPIPPPAPLPTPNTQPIPPPPPKPPTTQQHP
jgi:hypothetical protein